ncbi:hypothetical protein BH11MYX1_BH11MYX1_55750 [soil metagenome]
MTRQFHKALRSTATRKTPIRTPNPNTLSFTCFRLVPIYDRGPGEPPYASIELMETQNAMRAFVRAA